MIVSYKIPATTANIGAGFDCLGMAVNLYNTVTFEEIDSGLDITVSGNGSEIISLDETNMAYKTAEYFFNKVGYKPSGLRIDIQNYIPISRGLGSSSSIIIGSLLCANDISGFNLSKEKLLNIANEIEGHPDNITPALVGGFTASAIIDDKVEYKKVQIPDNMDSVVFIPKYSVSTNDARRILPQKYERQDVVYNISRVALLMSAMDTSDYELMSKIIDDKIHQPYRKKLIKEYEFVENIMKENSVIATFISGSGSTIMSFCYKSDSQEVLEKLKKQCELEKISADIKILSPINQGAIKIE